MENQFISKLDIDSIAERHSRGFYTLEEAAHAIAKQENWNANTMHSLLNAMQTAVMDGNLKVRNPQTNLFYRPNPVRIFYELVDQRNVNEWLDKSGAEYLWNIQHCKERSVKIDNDVPTAQALMPAMKAVPVAQPEAPAATMPSETPMSRTGLVKAHVHHWPTIEADLKDAARNGLSVAKAGERGWGESKALAWAHAKGKLTGEPTASIQQSHVDPIAAHFGTLAGLPRQKHTL